MFLFWASKGFRAVLYYLVYYSYKAKLHRVNQMKPMNKTLRERFPCLNWNLNTWFENLIYLVILMAMIMLVKYPLMFLVNPFTTNVAKKYNVPETN